MSTDGGLPKVISDNIPEAHWVRVESGTVASGTPDLNGCLNGREVWVECKAATGWTVRVRPVQVGWMERRERAGGRCLVAVRRNKMDEDVLWLMRAGAARVLLEGTKLHLVPADLIICIQSGGPSQWFWDGIREAMFCV
jgi:hypothetical protein